MSDWRANKYLRFEEAGVSRSGKTREWDVFSKSQNSFLGMVSWYAPWRQYVFEPEMDSVFNNGCLDAISSFCTEQNTAHRNAPNLTTTPPPTVARSSSTPHEGETGQEKP